MGYRLFLTLFLISSAPQLLAQDLKLGAFIGFQPRIDHPFPGAVAAGLVDDELTLVPLGLELRGYLGHEYALQSGLRASFSDKNIFEQKPFCDEANPEICDVTFDTRDNLRVWLIEVPFRLHRRLGKDASLSIGFATGLAFLSLRTRVEDSVFKETKSRLSLTPEVEFEGHFTRHVGMFFGVYYRRLSAEISRLNDSGFEFDLSGFGLRVGMLYRVN